MATVTIKYNTPYFEGKLKHGAIPSVAAWTGTKSKVTQVTSTATAAQIGAALGQLIDDLRTRGVIS
jgi:hypothetical protein